MNGVVFQISARQMTRIDVHRSPNQSVSAETPGSHTNQEFTKPELTSKANCQANADTTVITAYGMRIAARRMGRRARSALTITRARPKPRTSSTATVTRVMNAVTPMACHHRESVRITQ